MLQLKYYHPFLLYFKKCQLILNTVFLLQHDYLQLLRVDGQVISRQWKPVLSLMLSPKWCTRPQSPTGKTLTHAKFSLREGPKFTVVEES